MPPGFLFIVLIRQLHAETTRCRISETKSSAALPFEEQFGAANAFAKDGDFQAAAGAWSSILRSEKLAAQGGLAQASVLFNFAQALVELPACVKDASKHYSEAAAAFLELEEEAVSADDLDEASRSRASRGQALMGAAIAERTLCGGGLQGAVRVAKGKKKHCRVALKLLRRAQALRPDDPVPLVNEGNVLVHLSMPVEAANRYLAAARLDSAMAHNAHPLLREFLLTRIHLEGGREVEDLMEIAWLNHLPHLALSPDCILETQAHSDAVMVNHCTWHEFKHKNRDHADALKEAILLSWEIRSAELLDSTSESPM